MLLLFLAISPVATSQETAATTPPTRPSGTGSSTAPATGPMTIEQFREQMGRKVQESLPELQRKLRKQVVELAEAQRRRNMEQNRLTTFGIGFLICLGCVAVVSFAWSILSSRRKRLDLLKSMGQRSPLGDDELLAQLGLPLDRREMAIILRHEFARQLDVDPLLLRPDDPMPLLNTLVFDGIDGTALELALAEDHKLKYKPVVRPTRQQRDARRAACEGTLGQWLAHMSDPALWKPLE